MKFILISRHTGGREIPDNEAEQNLKDMGAWVGLLKNCTAMPIRNGKSITSAKVEDYFGDVGGVIVFDAENLEQAIMLAQKSPGLKYGFTHDVFPEISMESASKPTRAK
jgi:hypothetical protein